MLQVLALEVLDVLGLDVTSHQHPEHEHPWPSTLAPDGTFSTFSTFAIFNPALNDPSLVHRS